MRGCDTLEREKEQLKVAALELKRKWERQREEKAKIAAGNKARCEEILARELPKLAPGPIRGNIEQVPMLLEQIEAQAIFFKRI